jgi:hypothetical protein
MLSEGVSRWGMLTELDGPAVDAMAWAVQLGQIVTSVMIGRKRGISKGLKITDMGMRTKAKRYLVNHPTLESYAPDTRRTS